MVLLRRGYGHKEVGDHISLVPTNYGLVTRNTDVFQDLATQTVDQNLTLIGYSQKSSQLHNVIDVIICYYAFKWLHFESRMLYCVSPDPNL